MIVLYRILGFVFYPFLLLWIFIRLIKGKEERARIKERFGFSGYVGRDTKGPYNEGCYYIWIHAASVGESLIALTLIKHINKIFPKYHFIITSGTITSAAILASRLPNNAIHQFIPIDEYFAVNRFFKVWQPKLGILIESEIWPNLLTIGAKTCPLILTNAIMSDRSFSRWKKFDNFARYCLSKFSLILCQSKKDKEKYQQLCENRVEYIGNLKYSATKLAFSAEERNILAAQINGRPVLLAASTHQGDEEIIINAHQKLKNKYPNLLTIIAPRHPNRSEEIQKLIIEAKLKYSTRVKSSQNNHITPDTEIYLADSLGEMGLFYSLAHITFVGGSFANGGHNIIEPAFFDTNIIVGPDMSNSLAITEDFLSQNAILQAQNANDLIDKIDLAFTNIDDDSMIKKAKAIVQTNHDIAARYVEEICNFISKS